MKKTRTSKAMLDVWKWKEMAFQEVKDLHLTDAIRYRIESSTKTTEALGFKLNKTRKRAIGN
jgi:hypothetical protein